MKHLLLLKNTLVVMVALLSFASCSSDDDDKFDSSLLRGTWEKEADPNINDGGTVTYTFMPNSPTTGTIVLYASGWPDIETHKDLNYVVGHTGHMLIYTGKENNGQSKLYMELDIRKLTSTQMIWCRTDSSEELARFKKIKLEL